MKKQILPFLLFCTFATLSLAQTVKRTPTFEEILSLRTIRNPEMSPNGQHIVFEMETTDWEDNRMDTELWLSKNGEAPFPLTNTPKQNSNNPKWSPNGEWIAFLANKTGKTQIHVIRLNGGEAFPISSTKDNILDFEWSPNGTQIAFTQAENKEKTDKARKDKFGDYEVEDNEYRLTRLWLMNFEPDKITDIKLPQIAADSNKINTAKILLDSVPYTINGFAWSPDGRKIAIEHQPDPLINSSSKADISIVDIGTKAVTPLVKNLSNDGFISWSPNGNTILYQSALSDTTSYYYRNSKLFTINIDGTNSRAIAPNFDENFSAVKWTKQGIYALAYQKTLRQLFKIDPDNGSVKAIMTNPDRINDISFSDNGEQLAFIGATDNSLGEVYKTNIAQPNPVKISTISQQMADWQVAKSEVISWRSTDGETIEGVLYKPQDYDPKKKYPLFVVIHGGPTGISLPSPTPAGVYPIVQWLAKGALVLSPNYRGSAGYGERFRSLNVKNLGVGDAWDVLSGVQSLETKGIIDGDKVASMGWSQGGYISAFLTTNSTKFKAISVGAGISNWVTYYVSTDIHPFTRQYLKATPWSDKAIYEKTSPMTNIKNAKTPTLIQHGELDKRVPISNAYELFQGLQDVGVDTKLIVYKGFGHGITKPKERLAAVWHNWQWFGKYIWGEEIRDNIKH
jgi:dipeptidyl aminopeptidase/acylaminoacyl peptidase